MAKKIKTVKVAKTKDTQPIGVVCPKGQVWSPSLNKCIDDIG